MRKDTGNPSVRVAEQVRRMRELYSQIGEPLSADTIIDLHRHLAPALEAAGSEKKGKQQPSYRAEA